MSEDDTALLAMWDAKMSTASISLIMGRAESRVDRRIHQLLEARRAAAEGFGTSPAMLALPLVERANVEQLEDMLAVQPGGCAPPVYVVRNSTSRDPPRKEIPPAPPASAPKPQHRALMRRIYVPISPRKLRFMGWFLEAGWPSATVAHLFDVELLDLQEAFDLG